jgi:hypothetical protein
MTKLTSIAKEKNTRPPLGMVKLPTPHAMMAAMNPPAAIVGQYDQPALVINIPVAYAPIAQYPAKSTLINRAFQHRLNPNANML